MDQANLLITIHPVALLSVVDHYNRMEISSPKRVVGALLGEVFNKKVDVTNSFAIPFDEDQSSEDVWFLDRNYLESMLHMYKRVNAKEQLVGWYSSGTNVKNSDIAIHKAFSSYITHPVYLMIDVEPKDLEYPCEGYVLVEEVEPETAEVIQKFIHVPSKVGAFEAEEIGVEHLLRDIKETNPTPLSASITQHWMSVKSLCNRLKEIETYISDTLLVDDNYQQQNSHQLVYLLQDLMNILPNPTREAFMKAFCYNANDMMLGVYLSSIVHTVSALHDLVLNKNEIADRNRPKKGVKEDEEEEKTDKKEKKEKKEKN